MTPRIGLTAAILLTPCLCFGQAAATSPSVPVLVELFTSEGCSTCPPADKFLELLDTQPLPGMQLIVLSEHVNYWDHQGWKDPYSSSELTQRQSNYASRFRLNDVYTPQMVVDGRAQMSGVSFKEADAALKDAVKDPKADLRITDAALDGGKLRVHVESALNLPEKTRDAELYVAVALNHTESSVSAGENAKKHLTHTSVVRNMVRVAKFKAGEKVARDVECKVDAKDAGNLRVIAFLQEPGSGRVLGSTMKPVPH